MEPSSPVKVYICYDKMAENLDPQRSLADFFSQLVSANGERRLCSVVDDRDYSVLVVPDGRLRMDEAGTFWQKKILSRLSEGNLKLILFRKGASCFCQIVTETGRGLSRNDSAPMQGNLHIPGPQQLIDGNQPGYSVLWGDRHSIEIVHVKPCEYVSDVDTTTLGSTETNDVVCCSLAWERRSANIAFSGVVTMRAVQQTFLGLFPSS